MPPRTSLLHEFAFISFHCPSLSSLLCPGATAALMVFFCLQFVNRIHSTLYSLSDKTFHCQPPLFSLFPFAQLNTSHYTTFNMPGSFLSLYFCLHDYPRPACLFPFSGWQPLIHPLIPNSYIATSLWIEFLFSCSSHSTLFSALIGMYFTLYHHSLFLSFRPIKLYVSWRQEPT